MKTTNKNIRVLSCLGVAALLWVASLVYTLHVRSETARLAERVAENQRLTEELAPVHAHIMEYETFVATLPTTDLQRQSMIVTVSGNPAKLIEHAEEASPPFRLESIGISKAASGTDTLAVEAVFTAFSH